MWSVRFSEKAAHQFSKLPKSLQQKLSQAIEEKLCVNPKYHLKPLHGQWKTYYRFRLGDYRLLCVKEEEKSLCILVVTIKHRKEAYKKP